MDVRFFDSALSCLCDDLRKILLQAAVNEWMLIRCFGFEQSLAFTLLYSKFPYSSYSSENFMTLYSLPLKNIFPFPYFVVRACSMEELLSEASAICLSSVRPPSEKANLCTLSVMMT